VEELESRELLAAPTVAEQIFLDRLNDARANPAAYGASIGVNLNNVAPAAPLAFNQLLIDAARGHSIDMNNRAYFAHNTPEGVDPGGRIAAAGFAATGWGESIAAGYTSPEAALAALIIDAGIPDLGHRRHLLAIDAVFKDQRQVGIGIVQNGSGPFSNYFTIDTASSADNRPFLTGIVYNDVNANGRYDAGEGLGGATVNVIGIGTVTTFATGGYSIRVNPGTYTVQVSGGGLPATVTTSATIGADNVRFNFTPAGANGGGGSIGTPPSVGAGTIGLPGSGQIYATGADAGGGPQVNVYDVRTGALKASFFAMPPNFTGGVRVAVGDVTGDGIADVICAAGPGGGPQVTVYDGRTFQAVRSFFATSPTFTGGLFVATGDVNGDGIADIICGADAGGGPQVSVFSGRDGALLTSFFFTTPTFTGGARVASSDINGDGFADIIAAAGRGGGPQVTVVDGRTLAPITAFYATVPTFSGGIFVAGGDITGDGRGDIVAGADLGGGPQVTLFDGLSQTVLSAFYALAPNFAGGVRVGISDTNGDGRGEIITAAGPGGGPLVSIFDSVSLQSVGSFLAFDPGFRGGIWVGAS